MHIHPQVAGNCFPHQFMAVVTSYFDCFSACFSCTGGGAVAWWLMPRTPDPEVGGSSPTRVKPCCVLEQGTLAPQKVLVIPRKRWLLPNMTEKLFTETLRINQPTIFLHSKTAENSRGHSRFFLPPCSYAVDKYSVHIRSPVTDKYHNKMILKGREATEKH